MKNKIWENILKLREASPLVQNITNYVVMNNTANALLAIGASPIMAHAHSEISDMLKIAQSLVINIGTLDEYWVKSMKLAAQEVEKHKKPWVLDPVGAGASAYRDQVLLELLALRPSIVRGNASEIMALAKLNTHQSKGVDSTMASHEALAAAQQLAKDWQTVVCVSGAKDVIADGQKTIYVENGTPLMTQVTGMGCTATALVGAWAAIVPDMLEATATAMSILSVAGEVALRNSPGPGTLQVNILDKLHNLSAEEYLQTAVVYE
ncbi:MAG: hydroxyethylthiazole kinase [Fibrobacter sp.]|nr:hydroxyethylthiazole kinase [Fibrobacter sp.]